MSKPLGHGAANFIDWNYDTGIAIEYRRANECKKCGDCCKGIINLRMVDGDKDKNGGITTDGKGRWSEITGSDNREFVKFYIPDEAGRKPCYALGPDNLCSLNGEKPWCCQIWPTAPSDIEQFENCSYEFVEVDNWKIENEQS